MNFQMFKLVLEKAKESEIKLPTSDGSSKKQESSRKTSISALLPMPKPLTVSDNHNKLWKILKKMGIPDHLTCLLRNLYAGQEATVRTGHGRADWFQIGKGVRQGCILPSGGNHVVSLELRRHSRVTTGISAFPLGWPWEAQSSPRVARESWGWRSSHCRA